MKKYFQQRQSELYKAYKTSSALGHSVPKGNERELITSQFLTQHLPPIVQPCQGILVDQDTLDFQKFNQTNCPQLDLLLVLSSLPQLTLYGGSRIFFAESVVSVIEVKTELTVQEIERILKHCAKVKQRKRQVFGMYWAEPDDPTSGPSEKVPYYVLSFDTTKNAQKIMSLFKEKGADSGFSVEDQKAFYPDGIFTLNPDLGTVVLKEMGIHKLKINQSVPPFYGGEVKNDSLCALWFTLMAQIEATRFLNFPNKTYVGNLFPKPKNGD